MSIGGRFRKRRKSKGWKEKEEDYKEKDNLKKEER